MDNIFKSIKITPQEKGRFYEEYCKEILTHEYKNVFLWNEINIELRKSISPNGRDNGCDIVIFHDKKNISLVQCKYTENYKNYKYGSKLIQMSEYTKRHGWIIKEKIIATNNYKYNSIMDKRSGIKILLFVPPCPSKKQILRYKYIDELEENILQLIAIPIYLYNIGHNLIEFLKIK